VHGQKYYNGEFVYVANEATKERQRTTNKTTGGADLLRPEDYWVAKLLEIRAADEHHVYARIYWMYWPDELPPNTLDGKRTLSGRQFYHGRNELIASNHSKAPPPKFSLSLLVTSPRSGCHQHPQCSNEGDRASVDRIG
jgi:hypothetical protein